MKYDIDNTDLAVAALLIIAVVAIFALPEGAQTVVGAAVGFIGGVAKAGSQAKNGNGGSGETPGRVVAVDPVEDRELRS